MRRRARNVDNFPEDSARCNGSRRRNECRRLAATCYSRFGSTRSLPVLFGRGRVFGSHDKRVGLVWPYQYLGLGMAVA